jgi:hypothetical protein
MGSAARAKRVTCGGAVSARRVRKTCSRLRPGIALTNAATCLAQSRDFAHAVSREDRAPVGTARKIL